jgi:hypothetical protein
MFSRGTVSRRLPRCRTRHLRRRRHLGINSAAASPPPTPTPPPSIVYARVMVAMAALTSESMSPLCQGDNI